MRLLKKLYRICSYSGKEEDMRAFIIRQLQKMKLYFETDSYGNIFVVKGCAKTYPCVVAHMDEVHKPNMSKKICVCNNIVYGFDYISGSMTGIGADDKNGIWVCLKLLETETNIKCAFFSSEEIGCVGSVNADLAFFSDCSFLLECDRRGNKDIIVTVNGSSICSSTFYGKIKNNKYGYTKAVGLSTDVATLVSRGVGLSAVNLSCGYYKPHTNEEYTNVVDLVRCLKFVEDILKLSVKRYPFTAIKDTDIYALSSTNKGRAGRSTVSNTNLLSYDRLDGIRSATTNYSYSDSCGWTRSASLLETQDDLNNE